MSRSNQTEKVPNPAKYFFQFKSSKKAFQYYDKDKKENIEVPLPFSFIVLDTLSTVGGYSEPLQSGIWANEVRNTVTDQMKVRTKGGVLAEGLYRENIAEPVKAAGGNYIQSVYIAYKDNKKQLVLANIQMQKSALSAWIKFTGEQKQQIYKGAITVKTTVEEKKGTNKYQVPVFKMGKVTEATDEAAKLLDQELQAFLTETLAAPTAPAPTAQANGESFELTEAPTTNQSIPPVEEDDDLPF